MTAATSNRKVTEDVTNENRGKERQGSNWRTVWSIVGKAAQSLFALYQSPFKTLQRRRQQTIPFYFEHVRLGSSNRKKANIDLTFPTSSFSLKVTFSFKVRTCARSPVKAFLLSKKLDSVMIL